MAFYLCHLVDFLILKSLWQRIGSRSALRYYSDPTLPIRNDGEYYRPSIVSSKVTNPNTLDQTDNRMKYSYQAMSEDPSIINPNSFNSRSDSGVKHTW